MKGYSKLKDQGHPWRNTQKACMRDPLQPRFRDTILFAFVTQVFVRSPHGFIALRHDEPLEITVQLEQSGPIRTKPEGCKESMRKIAVLMPKDIQCKVVY